MRDTTRKASTRRHFLKRAGQASAALPLLNAGVLGSSLLWGNNVHAQAGQKKVVFIYVPDGATPNDWHPTGTGANFSLKPMSAPLDDVKDQCIFMDGINLQNAGHGRTSKCLAGQRRDTSLDLVLGKKFGAQSPYSSLHLGVVSNGRSGSLTRLNHQEPAYQDNPLVNFENIFNGASANPTDIGTLRKQSILDANLASINDLRAKLGSAEKARLDEHTASIEKMEQRLQAQAANNNGEGGECSNPNFNMGNFTGDSSNDDNFTTVSNLQMDITALALKCGMTRVVSLMLGNHQAEFQIDDINEPVSDYHKSIHGGRAGSYVKYRAYLSERVRYLIQRLAAETDSDGGSLLDNTIILQVTDMGDGDSHSGNRVPFMFAGGKNMLRLGQAHNFNGADHLRILDTTAMALGVDISNPGEYERYSSEAPLPGILV